MSQSKWELIKEVSGLPQDQRQWISFAVIIIAMASAISFLVVTEIKKENSARTDRISQDEQLRICNFLKDSTIAVLNNTWQQKCDKILAKSEQDKDDQISELKKRQILLEKRIDRTLNEAKKTVKTQRETHMQLKSTIEKLKK